MVLLFSILTFSGSSSYATVTSAPATGAVDFGSGTGPSGVPLSAGQSPTVSYGTRVKCNPVTKTGDWLTPQGVLIKNYYKSDSPLCHGYDWTSSVIKCVIAEDVFRFYGTKSNPYQGASLTRVYNTDWCSNDQIGVRDYLPNPVDALPVNTGLQSLNSFMPAGTIYNPNTNNLPSDQNRYQEVYAPSDNCKTTINTQVDFSALAQKSVEAFNSTSSANCYVAAGAPRIKTGSTCQSMQTSGADSIANAISKNDDNATMIKNLIFQNYSLVLANTGTSGKPIVSRFPASYAAAINNLDYPKPVSATTTPLSSAEQVTTMDSLPCSSIFDFIPVAPKEGSAIPESKMMGTCVVPVYLPGRIDKNIKDNYKVDFYGSFSKAVADRNIPRYLDTPFYAGNTESTTSNQFVTTLSSSQAKSIYANSVALTNETYVDDQGKVQGDLDKAKPNTLVSLVYRDKNIKAYVGTNNDSLSPTLEETGGYFFPFNSTDTRVPYAVSPKTTVLKQVAVVKGTPQFEVESLISAGAGKAALEASTAFNTASSALQAATCYGVELKPYLTSTKFCPDGKTLFSTATPCPSTSPTPTPTPTPSVTSSAGSGNIDVVDKSINNPSGDHNRACSGPVCVKVSISAPGNFTVGGTSRVQTVKSTSVQLLCNGHICNPSSSYDNSDPVLSTPIGQLSLVGSGGFTACSSSLQKDCDLALQGITPPSTPIVQAYVSSGFNSPTRASEAVKITLPAASITITDKKYVCVISHRVSWSYTDPKTKVTSSGSYLVCDQYGWVPDSSTTHSLGYFELNFTDGSGPSRPVTGTIGK